MSAQIYALILMQPAIGTGPVGIQISTVVNRKEHLLLPAKCATAICFIYHKEKKIVPVLALILL
jgi:hypothetical protein